MLLNNCNQKALLGRKANGYMASYLETRVIIKSLIGLGRPSGGITYVNF